MKPGAYADLVLVDGDPVENLDLIVDPAKNFVVIMKEVWVDTLDIQGEDALKETLRTSINLFWSPIERMRPADGQRHRAQSRSVSRKGSPP